MSLEDTSSKEFYEETLRRVTNELFEAPQGDLEILYKSTKLLLGSLAIVARSAVWLAAVGLDPEETPEQPERITEVLELIAHAMEAGEGPFL